MASFGDLDDDALRITLECLHSVSPHSLPNVRLANKQLHRLAREFMFRTATVDFRTRRCNSSAETLDRLVQSGECTHVRTLKVLDSGFDAVRESELSRRVLLRTLSNIAPLLAGLRTIEYNLEPRGPRDEGESVVNELLHHNTTAALHVIITISRHIAPHTLASSISLDKMHTLDISFRNTEAWLTQSRLDAILPQVKAILLTSSNLKNLRLDLPTRPSLLGAAPFPYPHNRFPFTPEEASRLPPLQRLDIVKYPFVTGPAYEERTIWADCMDFSDLRDLSTTNVPFPMYMQGRTPLLESLSCANATEASFFIQDLHEQAGGSGGSLRSLKLHEWRVGDSITLQRLMFIRTHCPHLEELGVTYRSDRVTWSQTQLKVIASMKNLRHVELTYAGRPPQSPLSWTRKPSITCEAVREMFGILRTRNPKMTTFFVRPATDMGRSAEHPHQHQPLRLDSLTFVIKPAEKDWDAAQGLTMTTCPELEEAKRCFARGEFARLAGAETQQQAELYLLKMQTVARGGLEALSTRPSEETQAS